MSDLNGLLNETAEEVLENMFFSGVMGDMEGDGGGERLCATVTFSGSSDGELGVSVPASTAVTLAAGFLGAEDAEVTDAQMRAVVGEMANVLCGAVLGRLRPDGHFVISPPEISEADGTGKICEMELQRHFELMEGDLAVGLTVQ